MGKVNDLTGKTVAGVIVLGKSLSPGGSNGVSARWMCLCKCGAPFVRDVRWLKDREKAGGVARCGLCADVTYAKSRGGFGGSLARELGASDAPLLEAVRQSVCYWCGCDQAPGATVGRNRISKLDWTREWSEQNMIAECGRCQYLRGFQQAHDFLGWVQKVADRHRKEEDGWEG